MKHKYSISHIDHETRAPSKTSEFRAKLSHLRRDAGGDREGGKTEFAEADGILRTFCRRYDNRVGYLLHHLTVHPGLRERRAGRENPIGKFLSVTGPRNGVASAAAATSISRGSDCDDGGSGARDVRRAYKLHTIALTSTIHRASPRVQPRLRFDPSN